MTRPQAMAADNGQDRSPVATMDFFAFPWRPSQYILIVDDGRGSGIGAALLIRTTVVNLKQGESDMADKGSRDKVSRENKKKAQHTPKEKRKLKKEKKQN